MGVRVYESGQSDLARPVNLIIGGARYTTHLPNYPILNKNRSIAQNFSAFVLSYDPLTILDQ